MNNIYIYNNLYELLKLINILIEHDIKPYNIKDEMYNPTLFDNIIKLDLSDNKNIINCCIISIGINNFNIIYKVFLSSENNKELIIFYYYLNCLKYKENTMCMRNLKCVNEALRINKYVGYETHKLKGFVRFRELNNKVLYAEIEPTNNCIGLLTNHFKKRLKNECFVIVDNKRNLISIYDKKDVTITNKDNIKIDELKYSDSELDIENLWTTFYKTIGIKERKNDRCRMNFMPKKYWKYIIEMSDEV